MNPASPASAPLPDAPPGSLVLRLCPTAWRPYLELARIDRPIGWWLLLLPCWQSSALASIADRLPPHWLDLVLFLIGAIAMRGAGSTYNDILDRDIDAKVERTRGRPLPSGRTNARAATAFMLLQSAIGAVVLFSFNTFSICLGLASLAIVAVYPFAKRVTSWPQAVLGLAFAWGGLMGWAVARGSLSMPGVVLYFSGVLWTIGYDTIYAIQDAKDDPAAGVLSTARLFGERARKWVGGLFAAAVALAATAVHLAGGGVFAWAGLVGYAGHLAWQVGKIDPTDPKAALTLFRSNRDAGLIFFIGLFANAMMNV